MSDSVFLQRAIDLARENVQAGGRPFAALVVHNGEVVASGTNQMLALNDPTAHAELLALRQAGMTLGRTRLEDCTLYASGQPCPMCLAAIRMAGITQVYYAYSNQDAEPFGLSTEAMAETLRVAPQQQPGLTFRQLKPLSEQQPALYRLWQTLQ